jgi:hypothetical protein
MDSLSTMPPQVLYLALLPPIVHWVAVSCALTRVLNFWLLVLPDTSSRSLRPEMYIMSPSLQTKDSTTLHTIQDIEKSKREMFQFIK